MNNIKQIVMNMVKNNCNPIMKNLIEMAEKGQTKEVENFARNMMKEQGRDFDKEMTQFKENFNIK